MTDHDRIAEFEKRVDQRFSLNDRALNVALDALEKRLNGMNEIRESMRDQAATFVNRESFAALEVRLRNLEAFKDNTQGKTAQTIYLVGLALVVVQVLIKVLWR